MSLSVGCEYDVQAFEAGCSVELMGDSFNRWRLLYVDDGQSEAKAAQQTKAALLHYTLHNGGKIRGPVTISFGKGPPKGWGPGPIYTRHDPMICSYPVALEPGSKFREVYVEFVWRGSTERKPWLALRAHGLVTTVCPVGAETILDAVWEPTKDGVPDEYDVSPLPPSAQSGVDIIGGAVEKITSPGREAFKTVAIVGGLIGVGLILNGIVKR